MGSAATFALVLAAGLSGAAGVAFAALAAHGSGEARLMASAAEIALVHAPSLLALAALPAGVLRFRLAAGLLLAAGVVLFSGDLASRFFNGGRLFVDAAPTGGSLLIVGWLLVAAGATAARFYPPAGRTGT
ncbi:DUF423 domain-containing protein [Aureimonas leprariae]|uniref:DUF423 domain-containing protein n=1 Tax=Plantimonas leprariae TaxID=2615207 RepID=A0A7V7PPT7_9HYPH|nr:DUF423 domain-containing protein [Aureimonas leprariae]KAB0680029.1 DUF423 domain-containing protein [Aureimonas leprariae]